MSTDTAAFTMAVQVRWSTRQFGNVVAEVDLEKRSTALTTVDVAARTSPHGRAET